MTELQSDQNEENPLDLKKPNPKTKIGLNSFSYKGPNYWNKVANNIREIQKRDIFKKTIKMNFLDSYDNLVEKCNNPRCSDQKHHSNKND